MIGLMTAGVGWYCQTGRAVIAFVSSVYSTAAVVVAVAVR
jgi:hypothetical protein